MEDFIIVMVSMLVLISSFLCFRYCAGSMSLLKLNMISFNYYYHIILQTFIGSVLVAVGVSEHYEMKEFLHSDLAIIVWGVIIYAILSMGVIMCLCSRVILGKEKIEKYLLEYHMKWPRLTKKHDFYIIAVFSLIAILSVAYVYYCLENIPWIYLLKGMTTEAAKARIQASRNFEGVVYIRNIIALGLTPILCYISYCYKINYNEKRFAILFYLLLACTVLILIYDNEKGPLLSFIIGFFMLKVLAFGKQNWRFVGIMGVASIILIVIMYMIMKDGAIGYFSINSGPIGRIIQSQLSGLYMHFSVFPDVVPFLQGEGLPRSVAKVFGLEGNVSSARLVMEYYHADLVVAGSAGVQCTFFLGEAWANFGWMGIIIAPVIISVYWNLLYIMFICFFPKHPMFMGLYAYMCINIPLTGGFFGIFLNPGYVVLMLLVILMYKMRNIYVESKGLI